MSGVAKHVPALLNEEQCLREIYTAAIILIIKNNQL